jgi:hypothetical protein
VELLAAAEEDQVAAPQAVAVQIIGVFQAEDQELQDFKVEDQAQAAAEEFQTEAEAMEFQAVAAPRWASTVSTSSSTRWPTKSARTSTRST